VNFVESFGSALVSAPVGAETRGSQVPDAIRDPVRLGFDHV
jgi:hypothetical protein